MKGIIIAAAAITLALCSGCLYPPQSTCESGPGTPLSYASGTPLPEACQDWGSLSPEKRAEARIAYQTQTAVANQPEPSFWRWLLTPEPGYPVYQTALPEGSSRGYINSGTPPNFGPLPGVEQNRISCSSITNATGFTTTNCQ
jgi:hypothetical protein